MPAELLGICPTNQPRTAHISQNRAADPSWRRLPTPPLATAIGTRTGLLTEIENHLVVQVILDHERRAWKPSLSAFWPTEQRDGFRSAK